MLKLFGKKRSDDELHDVLGDEQLPTFPAVVMRALDRVRDPDADLSEVADLLAADPGLSVRLLGTVNSASFALRHRVKSVHHAIALCGRNEVESILISTAVREALRARPLAGFEPKRFWSTAARRAVAAGALAEAIEPAARSESFTAALLQDMALPILAQRKGPLYGELLDQWHQGADDLVMLEREAYGWDHARIASLMADKWKFPELLAEAIGAHHGAHGEGTPGLAAVKLVSVMREVDDEHGVDRLVAAADRMYNLPADRTVALVRESFEDAEEIARLFL